MDPKFAFDCELELRKRQFVLDYVDPMKNTFFICYVQRKKYLFMINK
jgi:hypothetical protein